MVSHSREAVDIANLFQASLKARQITGDNHNTWQGAPGGNNKKRKGIKHIISICWLPFNLKLVNPRAQFIKEKTLSNGMSEKLSTVLKQKYKSNSIPQRFRIENTKPYGMALVELIYLFFTNRRWTKGRYNESPLNSLNYLDILFHGRGPNLSTVLQNGATVGNEGFPIIFYATALHRMQNKNTTRNLSSSPRNFNCAS